MKMRQRQPLTSDSEDEEDEHWRGLHNTRRPTIWNELASTDLPSRSVPASPTHRQQNHGHNSGTVPEAIPNPIPNVPHDQYVEIKIPSYVLAFANVQINISPTRTSSTTGESSRPSLTPQPNIAPRNSRIHSPTPRTSPFNPNLGQHPSRDGHAVTQDALRVPQPIYPLPPGAQPALERAFDQGRTHGYYVVFVGPRLGIFHEYWSDLEPHLRKGRGGYFRKGTTYEHALALWDDHGVARRIETPLEEREMRKARGKIT
ncbi:hypothetical protein FIBSPDRAFT_885538 [Athelia psychrophila]|uniref:Uncharacterized protein n=1 Tax=Athelia psychrophila TaxID=1759441 RepID=A0A166RUV4_9AGAM|nr:hypothetical protein FIBSPDRAFT_885538 [Fibularhizoctonia sp. CBS 109695]